MTPAPLIPSLAPNVVSLDGERAWRELQVAIKAACAMAGEADERPPVDTEPKADQEGA